MGEAFAVEGLALLGFLAVFHVIGGAAMGIGARQWRIAWSTKGARALPFLLLWGALFGGIPLIFGLATAEWVMLAGQAAVLLAAFAITFWFIEPLKEALGHQYIFMMVFGGIFMAVGALTGTLMLSSGEQSGWQALVLGGLFFAVGSLVFAAGIVQWARAMGIKGEALAGKAPAGETPGNEASQEPEPPPDAEPTPTQG